MSTDKINANTGKSRSSNLELYRIIVMLLIIAHHYVINSGLTLPGGPIYSNLTTWKSLFLLSFGAFGKIGINCFVLITGYFMCKSQISAKKFAKLFFEVVFYDVIISTIFYVTGYSGQSFPSFLKSLLPFTTIAQNFTGCYLVFFLCIPFLNVLIHHLTQKQHFYLIILLGFTYVFMGTIPFFSVTMNYVSWYIVLFVIASYIRLYPTKTFEKTKLWGWLTLLFVILSISSVIISTLLMTKIGKLSPYMFVTDSNTLLALLTALSSFIFFKNLKIPQCKFINLVAKTSFGVLLIHTAGDSMRKLLWNDILNNVGVYDSNLLPLHAVGSVIAIYAVCFAIDFLRIKFIETPIFKLWDKHYENIKSKFLKCENKLLSKLGISSEDNSKEN